MTSSKDAAPADIVVIGAGPAGLWAAYCAGFRGLSVIVVDSHAEPGGQVAALYPNKKIYDIAGLPGVTGANLVANLMEQAAPYGPRYLLGHRATSLHTGDRTGELAVELEDGTRLECSAVILASGVGGIEPRPLPVGHEWLGRGLSYTMADPTAYAGLDVVVVGGGDSAVDWALEALPHARTVTVVHRRRAFRAHAANLQRAVDGGAKIMTDCEIVAVDGDAVVRTVTLRARTGEVHSLRADAVVGALGLISDLGPLTTWGLEMHDRRIRVDTSMRTNLSGVFAIGDAAWYPGKVALMSTGFGDAATAANNAAVLIDPEAILAPGHSTDRSAEPVQEEAAS